MQPVPMNEAEAELRLEASISGFADRVPLMSARNLISRGQRNFLIGLLSAVVIGLVLSVQLTITAIIAFFTLLYLIAVIYRAYLFTRSSRSDALEIVTDEEALIVPDSELPYYTILLPVYNEASVIIKLIENLAQMDYPASRLEVLLLVEEDDDETLGALRASHPPAQFKLVVVPPAEPRTKPKALNFGLTLARGDIVAVYDAEDTPDILQLRRAAVALGRYGPEVACVQGQLSFRNAPQNIITRWFTIEYAMWFSFFLPGLVTLDAPIPLGGTSNHFKIAVLRELHGWDPFNVTEDADLGIRLAQKGYRVGVVDTTTFEEASCHAGNWIRQRSRWIKGYMQTLLVHTRRPIHLLRAVGPLGFLSFMFFIGGTVMAGLINPIFWMLYVFWLAALWSGFDPSFPRLLLFISLFNLLAGNGAFVYLGMLAPIRRGLLGLIPYSLTVSGYWVLISIAAYKALWQLIRKPFYWEKTRHGVSRHAAADLAKVREATP
jgi:glycosyltransferase XagB